MQAALPLAALLALALAVAGCTSEPPPPADGGGPVSPTGAGGGAGGTGGNSTGGNTTAGNATGGAAPPGPREPQSVHSASHQWQLTPPAEATFTLDAPASLTINITQEGPGVGTLNVELVNPQTVSAGTAAVTANPEGTGTGTLAFTGPAGEWTLRFTGNGVGTLHIEVLAA